jgi:hypothetical protein
LTNKWRDISDLEAYRDAAWLRGCNLWLSSRWRAAAIVSIELFEGSARILPAQTIAIRNPGTLQDETKELLLKSASGLLRRFRFVRTVIILQQVMGAPRERDGDDQAGPTGAAAQLTSSRASHIKNSVRDLAEQLSRGWRFFPTYAQIQTGSVLSNSHFCSA